MGEFLLRQRLYCSCWLILLSLFPATLLSQNLVINELMSSNFSSHFDEFGSTPDWIEILNPTSQPIKLDGYSLSDDKSIPQKWTFPNISINQNGYLLVNASGRNIKTEVSSWETIIDEGDDWKYYLGTQEPSSEWKKIYFDDDSWNSGQSGIGYGDGDDATIIPPVNSVYLRKSFNITDVDNISNIMFNIDFDDGFIAFINDQEIARSNLGILGEFIPYNRFTENINEARLYKDELLDAFLISDISTILVNGENVISIQVHNANSNSSDLTAIPFLTVGYKESSYQKYIAQEVESLFPELHANFKILNEGETIYLSNNLGELIDSVSINYLPNDISYGRSFANLNNWLLYDQPTPGKPNTTLGYLNQVKIPTLDLAAGFYENSIDIKLMKQNEGIKTYYTLNGSNPDTNSILFTNSFEINNTAVIKLKSFAPNSLPSQIRASTFLINENKYLPVVSISTDPKNLWDYYTGIYVLGPDAESNFPYFNANFWQNWERPSTFEFYDNKTQNKINTKATIKIFGAWSRGNEQKSISIFPTNGSNDNNFSNYFSQELNVGDVKSIVLRNSGNDWNSTMLRDGFIQSLAIDLNIDKLAYQPAVLYLNGEYWGIHNIREKINLNYFDSHYDVVKNNIDLLESNGEIIDGDNVEYWNMINFLDNNNLKETANYEVIKNLIDIESFIDYNIIQIYSANTDWPGNNNKFWKEKNVNGKWRWILFDTDFGFGWISGEDYAHNTLSFALEPNGPEWPNPPWATYILRKLIENQSFNKEFINRFSDLFNTSLKAENVIKKLSQFEEQIKYEIPNHLEKWNQFTYSQWEDNIFIMEKFAALRIPYLSIFIQNQFDLDGRGTIKLNISDSNSGKIQINSIMPDSYPWQGDYFLGSHIKLIANSNPGFLFREWSGDFETIGDTLVIEVKDLIDITANFQPIVDHPQVIINEINYNSNSIYDTKDWIELYNNSDHSIALANWILKDERDDHIFDFPEDTYILAGNYLVVCRDTLNFSKYSNDNVKIIGDLSFGFANSGDLIRLFNDHVLLIDSVRYDDIEPWPAEADGSGNTLELINPKLDNSVPINWRSSTKFGSPGFQNTMFVTSKMDIKEEIPDKFSLSQNFPNPFNPITNISFTNPINQHVKLEVFNILGQNVKSIVSAELAPGKYLYHFDGSNLASGIYFYKLSSSSISITKKMIILK
jgi:CotH kinase protein/Lamin Tail Domain/Secretion system C-terminal sorting domain/Chitobiase/beta-hexosaminidase C-terminal domain